MQPAPLPCSRTPIEDRDPSRDVPAFAGRARAARRHVQGNRVRIPKPAMPSGPRRIGIQVGHLDTDQVPAELGTRIIYQTGTSWDGIDEVDVNLDIAQRIKAQLTARGYIVDIIPTTVPAGYLADVFLALPRRRRRARTAASALAWITARAPRAAFSRLRAGDPPPAATGLSYDSSLRRDAGVYSFPLGRSARAAAHTPAGPERVYLSTQRSRFISTGRCGRDRGQRHPKFLD